MQRKKLNYKRHVSLVGVLLSMVGTFALARSTFEYEGMVVGTYHPLLLDPISFNIALVLLGFGFAFQYLEKWIDDFSQKYQKWAFYVSYTIFYACVGYWIGYSYFSFSIF